MDFLLQIAPLLLCLAMFLARQHMLFVGLSGGLLAMLLGGLGLDRATPVFLEAIRSTVGVEVPIMYAALGGLLSEAGCFRAMANICRHYRSKGHLVPITAALVFLQGLITYMIGLGVSTTYLIAPVLASLTGASRPVIASLAIISAIGFSTSPASPETLITAQIAQRPVVEHATAMLPYTLLFYALAAALAAYGVRCQTSRQSRLAGTANQVPLHFPSALRHSAPAVFFLLLLIAGNPANTLLGTTFFTPLLTLILVPLLTVFCTPFSIRQTCVTLIESSRFVLMVLFSVGIFWGFIDIIGKMGAFSALAELASIVPRSLCLPAAMLIGFLVAIPAGAFCTGVLALTLPTMASLNIDSVPMGFIAMAIALGSHLCPVQVNVGALRDGFSLTVKEIVRGNIPYILSALAIAMAAGACVVG
ncbi:MAG: hypothetical protein LBB60_10265 [Desulfovibrio sp.]|jgi:hypothetical protein|nr:hypothetical protein [Desulfovibrio sp.]